MIMAPRLETIFNGFMIGQVTKLLLWLYIF